MVVKDQQGADAGSVELTEFDGATNHTSEPHTTSVVAWDVPSAVVAGERFRMKVGIKCSNECPLTNRDFGIYDDQGARVAQATLGSDRWPGTTGLYVTEIELTAPEAEGLYTWGVRVPESDAGTPHDEGSVSFGVRVVRRPEHLVTVEAIDRMTQTPLREARVVMHPYRTVTDEHGLAEMRVAKGTYTLFVSQNGYLTLAVPVDVDSDVPTRAELDLELVPERE